MLSAYSGSDAQQSTLQLVMDQLEELLVTVIEEIRERPGVAAAILAAVVGAIVGSVLARAARRRSRKGPRAPKAAHRLGELADLAGLGVQLLENPLVRSYARAAITSQFKRRTS
jgi:hypothetical protein